MVPRSPAALRGGASKAPRTWLQARRDRARRRTRGHDNIDLVLHELRRKTGKAVELAVRIDVFGFDRATLDVTELAHPPSVFFQKAVPFRLRSRYQPPDARKLSGMLLGKRLERRRDCGCAKRNEQRAAVYHQSMNIALSGEHRRHRVPPNCRSRD